MTFVSIPNAICFFTQGLVKRLQIQINEMLKGKKTDAELTNVEGSLN